ncbi:uncharacterized protein LOC132561551 [Ylistrum balloti]|uniref:uncharacterized protein LOC132561551 n=1 Tax=Ylistrum balloti TaxID=509963 RepID=UPI002905E7CA|nr:uncharacterized protein LOC132561551 [Ylistrum balloti]
MDDNDDVHDMHDDNDEEGDDVHGTHDEEEERDDDGDDGDDECKTKSYGCDIQEINEKDFTKKNTNCKQSVDSLIQNVTNDGLAIVTFRIRTQRCPRNQNRSRGVVIELTLSRDDDFDYKIFALETKRRLQTKSGPIYFKLMVTLPNIKALFITRVSPIQTRKGTKSLMRLPIIVGDAEERNTNVEKINQPNVENKCRCEDITYTTNKTISLNLCGSQLLKYATVTLQGSDSIYTPTNKSDCEENYLNLPGGVYTVLTHFECKNNKSVVCPKKITIQTETDSVKTKPTEDAVDVNKVLWIVGTSTGIVMALIVLTYGMLMCRHHNAVKRLKERKRRIKERNDIMLVYIGDSLPKEKIGEFASLLFKDSQLPVHFVDDKASQGQIFSNKFDWLDKCVQDSSNFVFIASKDLYTLLKSQGNADFILHSEGNLALGTESENDWLAQTFCYVMNLLRGTQFSGLKRRRFFIVSFDCEKRQRNDYAHKISKLSIFQSKGTKICYVSQEQPMTVPVKLLLALRASKHSKQSAGNDDDTMEQGRLLPMEDSNENIPNDV